MVLSEYTPRTPPTSGALRVYLFEELKRIASVCHALIVNAGVLAALGETKIQIGPADSGGTGYKVLRIPN